MIYFVHYSIRSTQHSACTQFILSQCKMSNLSNPENMKKLCKLLRHVQIIIAPPDDGSPGLPHPLCYFLLKVNTIIAFTPQ